MKRALLPLYLYCAVALVFATPAWAKSLGPLEKNHPTVERGTRAYEEGRYEDALAAFEAAKREVPGAAELDHNIGDALYKLGRYDEAAKVWNRALGATDDRTLRQKEFFNLGNAYAAQQKDKEAIAMYRKALALDPKDEQARHNLEVLLRRIPPKDPPSDGKDGGTDGGADGGTPDAGPDAGRDGGADAGTDAGQDGGAGDGGSGDGGAQDGGPDGGGDGGSGDGGADAGADAGQPGDAGSGDGGQGDGGSADGGGQDGGADGGADGGTGDGGAQDGGAKDGGADGGADGGGGEGEGKGDGGSDAGTQDAGTGEGGQAGTDGGQADEVSRQEAENLLDSMRQNEKNHQLWRFQQRKKPRQANEKDW